MDRIEIPTPMEMDALVRADQLMYARSREWEPRWRDLFSGRWRLRLRGLIAEEITKARAALRDEEDEA